LGTVEEVTPQVWYWSVISAADPPPHLIGPVTRARSNDGSSALAVTSPAA
jgi:hypothetical protein